MKKRNLQKTDVKLGAAVALFFCLLVVDSLFRARNSKGLIHCLDGNYKSSIECLSMVSEDSFRASGVVNATFLTPWSKPQGKIEYLHIPKAGTSFGNVLVQWACPWLDSTKKHITVTRTELQDEACLEILRKDVKAKTGLGIADHISLTNRTFEELQNVFTMIRSPKTRLASGYYYTALQNKSLNKQSNQTEMCKYIVASKRAHTARGTQVKMILGKPMTVPGYLFESSIPPTLEEAELAGVRLFNFSFFGISDFWEASMCLFHALYGGEDQGFDSVHLRKGHYSEDSLTSVDCEDVADERLFEIAMRVFLAKVYAYPECRKLITYKNFGNPRIDEMLTSVINDT